MKKLSILALALAAFAVPGIAQASHHDVFISKIVRISSTSCAVELQITGPNQNNFGAADFVRLDSTDLLFGAAFTAINSHDNDAGEHILVASDTFSGSVLAADVTFSDSNCANFDANAVLGYYIEAGSDDCGGGTPCKFDEVNSATVTGAGADNTAITKTSKGGTPTLRNLADCSLTIANSNNTSNTAVIGTGSTCGSGGTTGGTTGGGTTGSGTGGGGGEFCGNHFCASTESSITCPTDCGSCGDGICGTGETSASCAADCNIGGAVCGNGTCESEEDEETCAVDCGECGDDICGGTETTDTCPADCGTGTTGGTTGGGGSSGGCSLIR